MVLISLVTVPLFLNLASASEVQASEFEIPAVRTVWENAWTLTSFHQDGKVNSTFFSFPKVIWNGSQWVDYIFNPSNMSGGIGSIYIKIHPTHTIIYDPDRTEERIKDERWVVEWYDESAHVWRLDQTIENEIGYASTTIQTAGCS